MVNIYYLKLLIDILCSISPIYNCEIALLNSFSYICKHRFLKHEFTMVNIDDFVKRLEIILDYYTLNASSFADKIGVQRSSMSHLLSGRNKPSLDFVMKIMEIFPDVDLYWILNGTGSFPKTDSQALNSKEEIFSEIIKSPAPISSNENFMGEDLFSEISSKGNEKSETRNLVQVKNSNLISEEGEIERIVFFYKNGTFKVYIP